MRVGQSINRLKKYKNNVEFRKKIAERRKTYNTKNRKKLNKHVKDYNYELSLFKNKSCELCGNLLHYTTKGNYCRECLLSNTILQFKK